MINFKIEESKNAGVLKLDGELSIEQAAELKTALINSIENSDNVIIDIEDITEIDLSCMQLLCSAHQTLINLNKHLDVIVASIPDSDGTFWGLLNTKIAFALKKNLNTN